MTAGKNPRTVRSFVRRTGRLTPAQQRALDELWPKFGIEFAPAQLDLERTFGRRAPCVFEIGFGNGETLAEQASLNPERNYLGVEVHEPGIGHCLLKIEAQGIANLRLLRHDAIEVLKDQLPEQSLDRINLYFPDPWPKKRHHKRRIVNAAFLDLCARVLGLGSHLHIATDWENYAEHIDEQIVQSTNFRCAERRKHNGDQPLERPNTKFEQRGLKIGHKIVDWKLARI
ncbi:MAG: tRNA (guanosine(46)-N7)-methyltransferase TrmB [Woeseia sp.]|nr:tRNA (guanosine(46)-N7)-methyltransferase TrmB [Woeseia sp.]MBT8097839.1 tRNA (guanosine(46)-N7)-methyltransferase TrmB [Woeseia sp.]NNE59879.1 tRNA (guanosine(46)-N7)-methyltransferase TrmB [Woeseia sp.]NNL53714.1 tRNA (guanosine(46)-N7)-methyltransferase TrmB [Woeseia sp.]